MRTPSACTKGEGEGGSGESVARFRGGSGLRRVTLVHVRGRREAELFAGGVSVRQVYLVYETDDSPLGLLGYLGVTRGVTRCPLCIAVEQWQSKRQGRSPVGAGRRNRYSTLIEQLLHSSAKLRKANPV